MSKVKKVLAVLVSMAMMMAMCVTAFADEAVTITVSNATDATLSYVQVIKADPKTETGWAFTDEKYATDYINALGITATVNPDQEAIKALILEDGKSSKVSVALNNVRGNGDFAAMANPQTVTAAGVYVVKATETGYTYSMMAAYVGFGEAGENYPTLTSAILTAKKSPIEVTKDNNDEDDVVQIADTMTFTINAYVPYINPNDTDKSFWLYDEISGATYDDLTAVTITMDGDPVTATAVTNGENKFKIDLSSLINAGNTNAGKAIVVSYDATVTGTIVNNKADIDNADHNGNSDFHSTPVETKAYTGQITLTKYAEDGETPLANAGFNVVSGRLPVFTFTKDADGAYVYDPAGTITEVVTDENGQLVVKGLGLGNYHFQEITAPEGYSINANGADADIELAEDTTVATAILTAETNLNDTKLSSLPSTGGIGTTIFTIGGCIIMIAAAGLFFFSRKKSSKTTK